MDAYFRDKPDSDLTVSSDCFVVVECSSFPKVSSFDTVNSNIAKTLVVAPIYSWVSAGTYYHESPNNAPGQIVGYPTENNVSIRLTNLSGTTLTTTGYTQWVLTLNFTPI
eukprot:50039-Eustigmatos_ZCMA.PRE.1